MGTTMSFYHILNRGLSPTELQKRMKSLAATAASRADQMLKALLPPGLLQQMCEQASADAASFCGIFGGGGLPQSNRAVIAYSESAMWLPLFEETLCEGYIASSRDAGELSELFGAPVMAFAIFDSDILFVSYSDAANGTAYDYAKPNSEGFEEFDAERYSTAFPEFLLEFCGREELKAAWDKPGEVFADDRLGRISQLLQMELLYDGSHLPDGYRGIYAV